MFFLQISDDFKENHILNWSDQPNWMYTRDLNLLLACYLASEISRPSNKSSQFLRVPRFLFFWDHEVTLMIQFSYTTNAME